jgi:tripartite-type tricarboxylate transporter receptor subunit TctC
MRKVSLGIAALCAVGMATPAFAVYPDRPITVVIGSSAGASTDIGVRTWAPYMEKCLGNGAAIVPVNMQGAGGQVAFAHMATQPNDGYTLGLFLLPNFAVALATKQNLPYTADSFEYFSNYYTNSSTFSVKKESSIQNLEQYLDQARKEKVNLGIVALDSEDIFLVRDLEKADPSLKFELIPLGGGPQVIQALLGGTVDVALISISNSAPAREQLRSLAVASAKRVESQLPGVPTFKELGFDTVQRSAHVIGGPKGIPAEAREKLTKCFAEVATNPDFVAEATKRGLLVEPMTQQEATDEIMRVTKDVKARWEADPWIKQ